MFDAKEACVPLLTGPVVYLTDGAPASLAGFPPVVDFAKSLGSHTLLARIKRNDDEPTIDARFDAALGALPLERMRLDVVAVPRKELAAGLLGLAEVRGGVVALMPQRRTAFGRMLFGLIHERLSRETALPLLALPRDGKIGSVRRVLFPADLAPRSLAAFDRVIELCRALGAELDVVHVYGDDKLLPSEIDHARRLATKSPLELYNLHKQDIIALVERARAAGVQAHSKSYEGRAHRQILAHASQNPIDLIAMPTHGPRSADDILNGSTTIRVIHQSPLPVLVFRA